MKTTTADIDHPLIKYLRVEKKASRIEANARRTLNNGTYRVPGIGVGAAVGAGAGAATFRNHPVIGGLAGAGVGATAGEIIGTLIRRRKSFSAMNPTTANLVKLRLTQLQAKVSKHEFLRRDPQTGRILSDGEDGGDSGGLSTATKVGVGAAAIGAGASYLRGRSLPNDGSVIGTLKAGASKITGVGLPDTVKSDIGIGLQKGRILAKRGLRSAEGGLMTAGKAAASGAARGSQAVGALRNIFRR